MATIQRTVSVASLSSIMSDESFEGKKKKINNNSVTIGFKHHWFETTLKFIKEDHRLTLNYSVTPAQALFIRDTLNFEDNPSCKNEKYAPLYEALRIFGLKYNFKLSRVNKDIMVLQKIPKSIPRNNKKGLEHQELDVKLTNSTKLNKKIIREKSVIDRLSQDYMVDIAERILDFMEDPTRASLEFTKVKPLECLFMQCVMNSSRPMFPQHAQMLKYIKDMKLNSDFSLQVVIGKINKKTNVRTVTFKKEPTFSSKGRKSRESSLSKSIVSPKKFLPSSVDTESKPMQCQENKNSVENDNNSMQVEQSAIEKENSTQTQRSSNSIEQSSVQNKANSTQFERSSNSIEQNSVQNKPNSIQVERITVQVPMDVDSPRSVSTESSVSVGSKIGEFTVLDVDKSSGNVSGSQISLNANSSASSSINKIERGRRALDDRRAKLLEAMSMPVQLDKPTRMMQKMGWNGGPLGCRGTGITEPIMPALDLVSGAGFGHVTEPKPARPEVLQRNFRLDLLQAILDLIQTDKQTRELVYVNKIGKKDKKFVRHAVTSFSERQQLTLTNTEEAAAAKLIVEALRKLQSVMVAGAVSGCKKKITLTKVIIPEQTRIELPQRQTGVITSEHLYKLAETIDIYKQKTLSQKKYIGIRIAVLIEILHFVKNRALFKEMMFDSPLSARYVNYIMKAVDKLNMGKRPSVCAKILEQATCNEILRHIGNTILVVNFYEGKSGVLFQKRLPNQMNNENTSFNAFHSIDTLIYNYYDPIPYSNVCNDNGNKNEIIDLTRNGNVLSSNSIIGNSDSINNLNSSISILNKERNDEVGVSNSRVTEAIDTSTNTKSKDSESKDESVSCSNASEINNNNCDESKNNRNNSDDNTRDVENNGATTEGNDSDDDVVIIEPIRETIVISDDDSTDTSESSDTERNIIEKNCGHEIKITNVEGNVELEGNKSEGSADMDISKCNSSEDCQGSVDNFESQESTELDSTKSMNSVEFDSLNSEVLLRSDKTTSEESLVTARSGDTESVDIGNIEENIDLALSGKSTDQTKPINKTDIDKDLETNLDIVPKIEPKKEKFSYSEEFDRDLLDLEMVLNLDDDVFDYTIVKKEDPDRTDRPMSKRSRSDSEQSSPDNSKKTKIFTFNKSKNLLIVPKDYPDIKITKEGTIKIQTIISDAIDNCKELPLLKCHGIQDGGLIYSCHDEQSLFFVENCLSVTSDYKIILDVIIKKRSHNIKIRFNSLLDNIKKLFNRLELYNAGLITDSWCVKDIQKFDDYIVIFVELDDYSYKYICDNNFCLYAGIDEVQFTTLWD